MAQWSELIRRPVRNIRIGGRIVFGSGQECALTGERIRLLTIDEGVDGMLAPGSVISASCVLDLVNDDGQWNPGGECLGANEIAGATIMPELGILDGGELLWRPMGVFAAEEAVYLEAERCLRIQAVDSAAMELGSVFRDELNYPCTLGDVWEHALGQTRYSFDGEVPNGSATIDLPPDWKAGSLRAVLGHIACAAGCFVRIGRVGMLELCPLWDANGPIHKVDEECCLKLEYGGDIYGPVDSLRIVPAGSDEERIYREETALFAVRVQDNPLFQADTPGLDALARGMLDCVKGLRTAQLRFDWRGDPELCIGGRVQIRDLSGEMHEAVLTRQSMRFSSAGFSSACCCAMPEENNSGIRRAITPEGGLNAAALTGAVDGALLSVGSVTTNKLAAGSVTAEKIAAGALDTITLEAVTAKIEGLTAQDIETDRLAAALAAFTVMTAGTASFDRATVAHLVAEALNLEFGTAGQVFIQNLAVEYAQMVGAAIGNLCIKASDGNYYLVDVNPDGTVTATKTTVTDSEIGAGQTAGGQVILETNITAANLNAGNLLATYALVNRIDAARIDVDELFAREAFISLLRTSKIVGDKSLTMIAGEAAAGNRNFRQSDMPDGRELVRIGDTWTIPETGAVYQAEAVAMNVKFAIDEDGGLHYELEGAPEGFALLGDGFDLYAEGFGLSFYEDGTFGKPYAWMRVQDQEMKIHDGDEPPEAPVTVGKIWLDRSDAPAVFRRWTEDGVWEVINDTESIRELYEQVEEAQQAAQQQIDELRTAVVTDNEGLHVRKVSADDRHLIENEILITQRDINVVVGGARKASYAGDYAIINGMMIRVKNGILCIAPVK